LTFTLLLNLSKSTTLPSLNLRGTLSTTFSYWASALPSNHSFTVLNNQVPAPTTTPAITTSPSFVITTFPIPAITYVPAAAAIALKVVIPPSSTSSALFNK